MSEEEQLLDAIKKLYFWQTRRMNCFSDDLYSLMERAYGDEFKQLKLAFPVYAAAYKLWYDYVGEEVDFFRKYLPELTKK